jgi:DnaK suppressor protein
MKTSLESVRQMLESRMREVAPTRGLRESIRIHQVADPLDMTQQAAEREIAVGSLDRGSALVQRLRSAIERLNDGSYGACLQCDKEIASKRLKAIPWAELCIECQEEADRLATGKETAGIAGRHREAA